MLEGVDGRGGGEVCDGDGVGVQRKEIMRCEDDLSAHDTLVSSSFRSIPSAAEGFARATDKEIQ